MAEAILEVVMGREEEAGATKLKGTFGTVTCWTMALRRGPRFMSTKRAMRMQRSVRMGLLKGELLVPMGASVKKNWQGHTTLAVLT